MVQNLKKKLKLENFQFFSDSRGIKCRPKANNNREAVVVCVRHVVKRPSKRSVLGNLKISTLVSFRMKEICYCRLVSLM